MPWFPGMNLPLEIALEHNYSNIRKTIKQSSGYIPEEKEQLKKDQKEPFIPTVVKR